MNNVLNLIPEGATVQVGIGGIPDRITEKLALINGVSIFTGIISNGLLSFIEATNGTSKVVTGEIAGNHSFIEKFIKMTPLSSLESRRHIML